MPTFTPLRGERRKIRLQKEYFEEKKMDSVETDIAEIIFNFYMNNDIMVP